VQASVDGIKPTTSQPSDNRLPAQSPSRSTTGQREATPPSTAVQKPSLVSTLIRVFIAYKCGLANGASVQLKISCQTTVKEVVELVVAQIHRTSLKIGDSPPLPLTAVETENGACGTAVAVDKASLNEFCLCVVVGARERRLRDDFPVINLNQPGSPWRNGKLYIRHVDCISAAIHHGNEAFV